MKTRIPFPESTWLKEKIHSCKLSTDFHCIFSFHLSAPPPPCMCVYKKKTKVENDWGRHLISASGHAHTHRCVHRHAGIQYNMDMYTDGGGLYGNAGTHMDRYTHMQAHTCTQLHRNPHEHIHTHTDTHTWTCTPTCRYPHRPQTHRHTHKVFWLEETA